MDFRVLVYAIGVWGAWRLFVIELPRFWREIREDVRASRGML